MTKFARLQKEIEAEYLSIGETASQMTLNIFKNMKMDLLSRTCFTNMGNPFIYDFA